MPLFLGEAAHISMKMIAGTQVSFWYIVSFILYITSWLASLTYSSSLDSSNFVRICSFDGFLHKTYNLTNLITVRSLIECSKICMSNPECGSFFYLPKPEKLCQLHSVVFVTTDGAVAASSASYYQLTQTRCPFNSGYILHRPTSICYRYFPSQVSWDVAKQNCENLHNHLIDVKTPKISDHVVNFLQASSTTRGVHVSVGGSLVGTTWYWSDNSTVTWTNWASGEPSNSAEKCLCIAWFYYFKWNDVPCSGSTSDLWRAYICQLDM